MDQHLLGKIGDKIGETGKTRSVGTDSPISGQDSANKAGSGDTVELTSSAQLLQRLENTLASMPEIDVARVAEVKAQIENGEYQIDVENLVDALIRTDQEFGS